MYIQVKLLNGFKQELTYKVPSGWNLDHLLGSIVEVPLQQRLEYALVTAVLPKIPEHITFKIRAAHAQECMPQDSNYKKFIQQLAAYHAIDELHFLKRLRHFLTEKEIDIPTESDPELPIASVLLSKEQSFIVESLKPHITQSTYYPALIHGVTGSGKTEIYKKCIIEAHAARKSTLFLLPEVSLAVQFFKLLSKQLPKSIPLYSFHSATSAKEKKELWQQLLNKTPMVIIGVHLPMLLPIENLGLIIIDEEHEPGFQEKKHPKINTKEAALLRAKMYNIPIILGSATPAISSLKQVIEKKWHLFELKKRFAGAFPRIQLVKLAKDKRKSFWISSELHAAIEDRLSKKEQIIIFLNRRGYSFFVQCGSCGHIPMCTNCSVSLTVHNTGTLKCHYCNLEQPMMNDCTACKSSKLLKKGIGTQQIVSILEKLFPTARIGRADLDTTVNKKKWQQTITDFESHALDILVGTQTITKGYHFPRVTLVGILWADINLHIPLYTSAETTLQQLIQVAGRAGRQTTNSLVVVQHLLDHPIFQYMNEIDYRKFYDDEIVKRKLVNYPPCTRFSEIEIRSENEHLAENESNKIADQLQAMIETHSLDAILLGPTLPLVHTINKMHMRKIYLKSPHIKQLIQLFNALDQEQFSSSLFFVPNPIN